LESNLLAAVLLGGGGRGGHGGHGDGLARRPGRGGLVRLGVRFRGLGVHHRGALVPQQLRLLLRFFPATVVSVGPVHVPDYADDDEAEDGRQDDEDNWDKNRFAVENATFFSRVNASIFFHFAIKYSKSQCLSGAPCI